MDDRPDLPLERVEHARERQQEQHHLNAEALARFEFVGKRAGLGAFVL